MAETMSHFSLIIAMSLDIFGPRSGAISFPTPAQCPILPEGLSWASHGYFKVLCEYEINPDEHLAAPMPIFAMSRIVDAAIAAFNQVEATGEHGAEIRAYFQGIDPSAHEESWPYPVAGAMPQDLIIYRDGERVCTLWGNFGTEMIPEDSMITQLSTNCFGVFDTATGSWMDGWDDSISPPTSTYIGIWASPCLGVAN